jgi:hypothetical protein
LAALRTNFFLVDVDDAMVDVGTIAPYEEERRNALEEAHGSDYVFKRRGDALDVVKLVPAAPPLEGVSFEQRSARRLGKLLNVWASPGPVDTPRSVVEARGGIDEQTKATKVYAGIQG